MFIRAAADCCRTNDVEGIRALWHRAVTLYGSESGISMHVYDVWGNMIGAKA